MAVPTQGWEGAPEKILIEVVPAALDLNLGKQKTCDTTFIVIVVIIIICGKRT